MTIVNLNTCQHDYLLADVHLGICIMYIGPSDVLTFLKIIVKYILQKLPNSVRQTIFLLTQLKLISYSFVISDLLSLLYYVIVNIL